MEGSRFVGLIDQALADQPPEPSDTGHKILDAALDEVAEGGTRGATMDGVARRAGVGRMTVFRQFKNKDGLIERLVVRELQRFLSEVELDLGKPHAERVVDMFLRCLRTSREHPLVARLVRTEPGWAMTQLSRGEPSPLEIGRAFVADRIRTDEPALAADADVIADVLVRLTASLVLFPPVHVDLDDDDVAAAFARRTFGRLVAS